jgi:hypothetical protein
MIPPGGGTDQQATVGRQPRQHFSHIEFAIRPATDPPVDLLADQLMNRLHDQLFIWQRKWYRARHRSQGHGAAAPNPFDVSTHHATSRLHDSPFDSSASHAFGHVATRGGSEAVRVSRHENSTLNRGGSASVFFGECCVFVQQAQEMCYWCYRRPNRI